MNLSCDISKRVPRVYIRRRQRIGRDLPFFKINLRIVETVRKDTCSHHKDAVKIPRMYTQKKNGNTNSREKRIGV